MARGVRDVRGGNRSKPRARRHAVTGLFGKSFQDTVRMPRVSGVGYRVSGLGTEWI
jgi:hypothetical protein